jgi:hypothetical protein
MVSGLLLSASLLPSGIEPDRLAASSLTPAAVPDGPPARAPLYIPGTADLVAANSSYDAMQDCARIWHDARDFTSSNRPRLLESYFTGVSPHVEKSPQTLLIHIGKAAGTSLLNFYSKNDCFGMKLSDADCEAPIGPFGFNKNSLNRRCCAPFFTEVHALPASPMALQANPRVVVMLRDPVERFISAFNTHACLRDALGHKKRMMDCMRVPKNASEDLTPSTEVLQRLAELHADSDITGDGDITSAAGLLALHDEKGIHGLKCFPNVTYAAEHIEDSSGCALEFRRRITAPATWVPGMETLEHVSRGTCFYLGGLFDELSKMSIYAIRSEKFEEDLRGLPAFFGLPKERIKFPNPEDINMHTGGFPHHEDRPTLVGRRRLERLLVHEYAANAKIEQLSVNLGHWRHSAVPPGEARVATGLRYTGEGFAQASPAPRSDAAEATAAGDAAAAAVQTAIEQGKPPDEAAADLAAGAEAEAKAGAAATSAEAAMRAKRAEAKAEAEETAAAAREAQEILESVRRLVPSPKPSPAHGLPALAPSPQPLVGRAVSLNAPQMGGLWEDDDNGNGVELQVARAAVRNESHNAFAIPTVPSRSVQLVPSPSAETLVQVSEQRASRAAAAFGDRLQGAYSKALYGAEGRVDMKSLKLVWWGLMDETERSVVANAVGVCSQNDRDRFLCGEGPRSLPVPLFTPQGLPGGRFGDPRGALYVDNPTLDEAVPSHAWVEVTHCALAQHKKAFFGLKPDAMPAWAYVSHGSGVSVNVGNTAIIDEQAAFLAGFSRHGLSDAMAHLNTREKRQQSKLLLWLGLGDEEITALDSVQRIGHQEHWSTQRVHEVVFFNDGLFESSSLRDIALATPWLDVVPVMCGRYPELFRCPADSKPLEFMSNCSSTCEAPLPCASIAPCVAPSEQTDLGRRRLTVVTTLGFQEQSPPEGFQCGIPELRYAVRAENDRVMQPRPLWVPKQATPALEGIFWTHFPKTSTEFARTLLSYACGPTSFDAEMDVSTYTGIKQPKDCPRFSVYQQTVPHSPLGGPGVGEASTPKVVWFHEWVPWVDHERTAVDPLVPNVVSIFRNPAQRALSAFHYFYNKSRSNETCCGGGWGWEPKERRKLKLKMARADPFDALQIFMKAAPPENCMTNMLLGQGCLNHTDAARALVADEGVRQRVVDFVATGMAFVGILEKYDESVCLWHARFGEPLWTTEIQARGEGSLYDSAPYDSLKSKSSKRSFDEHIYRVALKRFDEEVKAHQEDVDECLTSINRHRTDLQLTLRQTPSHHDASLSSMEVNMMASRQEMASMEEDYH